MAHMFVYIILSLLCASFIAAQFSNQFAGPYDILFKQIARCSDEGTGEITFDKTRIVKYNRTTYIYSSNFSLPYGFNDQVTLGMSAYVQGNGGWKVLQKDREIGPACKTLKKLSPKLVKNVAIAMGTWPNLCPNPPGNYTVKDLPLQIELEMPILPYSKYMLDLWISYKGKRIGCGRAFVDIVPKKVAKKRRG